jgi:hypothetical protein
MRRKVNIEKLFEYPKQVQWKEEDICAGIGFKDVIICGCCGGVIYQDEWELLDDLVEFDDWVPFNDVIEEEEVLNWD